MRFLAFSWLTLIDDARDNLLPEDKLTAIEDLQKRYGATTWMSVFADMGASLLVVFNGLRLLSADFDQAS